MELLARSSFAALVAVAALAFTAGCAASNDPSDGEEASADALTTAQDRKSTR